MKNAFKNKFRYSPVVLEKPPEFSEIFVKLQHFIPNMNLTCKAIQQKVSAETKKAISFFIYLFIYFLESTSCLAVLDF